MNPLWLQERRKGMRERTKIAEGCQSVSKCACKDYEDGCEYNLFQAQDVQRDTIDRCVNCAKWDTVNFPLFASFQHLIWHWFGTLFLHLHPCPLLALWIQTVTAFLLFDWSQVDYSLFNDWLTSNKETLHYRMVQQAGETVLWGQHLSCARGLQHLITLKSKQPVPCICWALCMSTNYPWYMHRLSLFNVLHRCFVDDAHVQYLTQIDKSLQVT